MLTYAHNRIKMKLLVLPFYKGPPLMAKRWPACVFHISFYMHKSMFSDIMKKNKYRSGVNKNNG